tara:strand:- start:5363 stop:5686 length:324 start_codon:yes stop_codon:yes gene_type:complete
MLAIVALASTVPGQRCSAQSIQVADETDTIIRFDAVTGESAPEALGVPAQPSIPGNGPYFTSGKNFRLQKIRLASAFCSPEWAFLCACRSSGPLLLSLPPGFFLAPS